MQILALRNSFLHAEILPEAGGGVARLDWIAGGAGLPVFRPLTSFDALPRPNQLGCFALVPWSNRIGGGGFMQDGRFVALQPNREGEPCPIHGNGWQYPWQVASQSATDLLLTLDRSAGAPFSYTARLRYTLDGAALAVTMEATNTGTQTLPFGLGLHPWLPRSDGVLLHARARDVWRSGADHLPIEAMPMPDGWRFDQLRALPQDAVDHVFSGWDGRAEIVWPETGMRLAIDADLAYYIVYAPAGKDFFCFEPVDHLINAHNMPGGPERNGLTLLAPQQTVRRNFRFGISV